SDVQSDFTFATGKGFATCFLCRRSRGTFCVMLKYYSSLLVAFLMISGCSTLQAHVMCTQDDIKPASIEVRSKEIITAFLGTVESIECKDMRRADIRFNIEEVYKGPVLKKIVVQTERGGDVYAGG